MSDQSTSDFEQLKAKPIFMEIMQQGPRDAARVEAVLVAVLESILESLKFAEVRAALGSRRCQCHASCLLVHEELHAEARFQLRNRQRARRLRHVEQSRRKSNVALFGGGFEVTQRQLNDNF